VNAVAHKRGTESSVLSKLSRDEHQAASCILANMLGKKQQQQQCTCELSVSIFRIKSTSVYLVQWI